jgi:hypothetical protein
MIFAPIANFFAFRTKSTDCAQRRRESAATLTDAPHRPAGDFDAMKAAIRGSVTAVLDEIAEEMAAADEARRIMSLALRRAMAAALGEDVMRLLHATQ